MLKKIVQNAEVLLQKRMEIVEEKINLNVTVVLINGMKKEASKLII